MMSILLPALLAALALALYGLLGWRLYRLEQRQRQDHERLERLEAAWNDRSPADADPATAGESAQGAGPETTAQAGSSGVDAGPIDDAAVDDQAIDYEAIRRDLERLPGGEIGLQLLALHQLAPELASHWLDEDARRHFLQDFGSPLLTRLQRFVEAVEAERLSNWLEGDLAELLNQLARHLSVAAEQVYRGLDGEPLAQRLRSLLYDDFGRLCRQHGGYELQRVLPFETRFDPDQHHALGGRDIDGAAGLVVALKVVGRRYTDSGRKAQRARVVVGR